MNKLLLGLGALVLGLTLTGAALAQGGRHHHHPHRPAHAAASRAYYRDHATRFNGGYYYTGRQHRHWDYRVWDARYSRYQYYDGGLGCYYYWHPNRAAYYPTSYID